MQRKSLVVTALAVAGWAGSSYLTAAQVAAQGKGKKAGKLTKEVPLACNPEAMTPAQRKHYEAQKKLLRAAIKETKELPNGYAFRFASRPNVLPAVAEFIEGERRCCTFYTFHLDIAPDNGAIWLRITGPNGTKGFIKDTLTNGEND